MMATDAARLRTVVADAAFLSPLKKNKNGQPCILLQEEKNPDSKLLVIGAPEDLLILRADKFVPLLLEKTDRDGYHFHGTSFFRDGTGAGKRADYILFDMTGKHVIFLELKASKESEEHIKAQLAGAYAVLDYIRRVATHYHNLNQNEFIGPDFSLRFVGMCKTGYAIRKRPTKFTTTGRGKSINDFLRFSGTSEIHYSQLCGHCAS
ncbi:MAG: hypothetical protein ILM98_08680 [Kiritimatiellae bacterium]|nr:hypothetical protein [Kiritimatiellia bacterium]